MADEDKEQEGSGQDEDDDKQGPWVHKGASPDRRDDDREVADDKVQVVNPDGAPVPREEK